MEHVLYKFAFFVLSNICIIKGCICTVYKCYGHCHLHAPHTALASPERTQQSWCTLEATCVPKSWIFSVPLCSGSRFLIDHGVVWLKSTDSVCRNLLVTGSWFCADGIRFLVKCNFLFRRLLSHLNSMPVDDSNFKNGGSGCLNLKIKHILFFFFPKEVWIFIMIKFCLFVFILFWLSSGLLHAKWVLYRSYNSAPRTLLNSSLVTGNCWVIMHTVV